MDDYLGVPQVMRRLSRCAASSSWPAKSNPTPTNREAAPRARHARDLPQGIVPRPQGATVMRELRSDARRLMASGSDWEFGSLSGHASCIYWGKGNIPLETGTSNVCPAIVTKGRFRCWLGCRADEVEIALLLGPRNLLSIKPLHEGW